MRLKNFSRDRIQVPYKAYGFPGTTDRITFSRLVSPGEVTDELDPADPVVQLMLRAHPELRPIVFATAWEKVLAEIL